MALTLISEKEHVVVDDQIATDVFRVIVKHSEKSGPFSVKNHLRVTKELVYDIYNISGLGILPVFAFLINAKDKVILIDLVGISDDLIGREDIQKVISHLNDGLSMDDAVFLVKEFLNFEKDVLEKNKRKY